MKITGKALLAGVIGDPISHSLSPRIHNYWLEKYKIDGAYIPLDIPVGNLQKAVRGLTQIPNFRGINVTVPHKESVMAIVDEVDAIAKRIGAVNTLLFKDGRILATNTDAYGFIANLEQTIPRKPWIGKKAVVIGAGGAARAVCVGLLDTGVSEIVLLNRTHGKAEKIQYDFGAGITVVPWVSRSSVLGETSLLVNTTTLGMNGNEPLSIDLDYLPADAIVADIVYKPLETPLLKQARQRGNITVEGIGMLLHQAVAGFEAWFGVKPEVTKELETYVLQATS